MKKQNLEVIVSISELFWTGKGYTDGTCLKD